VEDDVTRAAQWAARVLGCLLPWRDVEAVVGDLQEEYTQRVRSGVGPNTLCWFWGQVFRSILPLVLTSLRRGNGLTSIGIVVGACVVQALIERVSPSAVVSLLGWVIVSYGANRVRFGAANMLMGLIVVAIVVQFLLKGTLLSLSHVLVLLTAVVAAFVGGALSLRLHAR
jgi:hypothetical protein